MKSDVLWSYVYMDCQKNVFYLLPMNMKLFLSKLITTPIKVHAHSFVSAVYNYVSDDTVGDNVVKLIWCWTLDVAHFM